MNLENQSSANLRARAHFESVVGTAAAGAVSGAVDRSTENFDPWEEAAGLARMPRESVVVELAAVIAPATAGASANDDSAANAARLIALLPRASGFGIPRYDPSPKRTAPDFSTLVIYLIVGGLIIGSALLGP